MSIPNPLPMSSIMSMSPTTENIHQNDFNFQDTAIIHPSQNFDKERTNIKKITYYTVDSRDRNYEFYPTPARYVISLHEDIPDVTSAEIIYCNVPFTSYLVHEKNNTLGLEIDGTSFSVLLDTGNYSATSLAQELENKLTETPNTSIQFKVKYDDKKDKFNFYADREYTFYSPKKNNIAKLLGFPSTPFRITSSINSNPPYSGFPHEIIPSYRKNFEEQNHIFLRISGFHTQQSINTVIEKTFAIIPDKRTNLNIEPLTFPAKFFNPPMASLARLQISFVDRNGELVDFQNHDHIFTLKIESLRFTRKYAAYV